MFHVRDGLFFGRLPDGSVRIIKTDPRAGFDPLGYPDAPAEFDVTIDEGSWRSVICSVSKYGEDSYRFFLAGAFHNGSDTITGLDTMPNIADAVHGMAKTERVAA